jgi:protein involved in polysaccharide export with SLBB domain
MTHGAQQLDVTVSGAVRSGGSHSLSSPATIRGALDAAGGFATPAGQMRAADTVTVRRPLGDRKVDVFRFSLSEIPPKWQDFALADGDLVVFQWRVEPEKT